MYEENDHRALGQRLDLFHLQEDAPGMVFWHPRGWRLIQSLEERIRWYLGRDGYQEVRTPQLLPSAIWEASGHWQHFRDGMFVVEEGGSALGLKPVSCPGHIQLFERSRASYRDLPSRFAEFGLVHRNEQSGALSGLFRLRQFTQDDGHVFCEPGQVVEEVVRFVASLRGFYADCGFDALEVGFSSRPAIRGGSEDDWAASEAALLDAAKEAGLSVRMQPGEGAFYGPKLEFALKDRLGRSWQCGTIQLDRVLPERFGISYVASGDERVRPVMLHRAMLGSLERFVAVLLEHHEGALPAWLAPEHVVVAPIDAESSGYAGELVAKLGARGVRARIDDRRESLSRRIFDARSGLAPYMAIVGARERERRAVQLRPRSGNAQELSFDGAIAELSARCRPR